MRNKKQVEIEEQNWLIAIQNKFSKYIANPYWDDILLTDTEYGIISTIMKTQDVNKLPILVNEDIVDYILNKIQKKLKEVKIKGL